MVAHCHHIPLKVVYSRAGWNASITHQESGLWGAQCKERRERDRLDARTRLSATSETLAWQGGRMGGPHLKTFLKHGRPFFFRGLGFDANVRAAWAVQESSTNHNPTSVTCCMHTQRTRKDTPVSIRNEGLDMQRVTQSHSRAHSLLPRLNLA